MAHRVPHGQGYRLIAAEGLHPLPFATYHPWAHQRSKVRLSRVVVTSLSPVSEAVWSGASVAMAIVFPTGHSQRLCSPKGLHLSPFATHPPLGAHQRPLVELSRAAPGTRAVWLRASASWTSRFPTVNASGSLQPAGLHYLPFATVSPLGRTALPRRQTVVLTPQVSRQYGREPRRHGHRVPPTDRAIGLRSPQVYISTIRDTPPLGRSPTFVMRRYREAPASGGGGAVWSGPATLWALCSPRSGGIVFPTVGGLAAQVYISAIRDARPAPVSRRRYREQLPPRSSGS